MFFKESCYGIRLTQEIVQETLVSTWYFLKSSRRINGLRWARRLQLKEGSFQLSVISGYSNMTFYRGLQL